MTNVRKSLIYFTWIWLYAYSYNIGFLPLNHPLIVLLILHCCLVATTLWIGKSRTLFKILFIASVMMWYTINMDWDMPNLMPVRMLLNVIVVWWSMNFVVILSQQPAVLLTI